MAKTVKFNMRFGETSIRTIEDLQENFVVEDVFEHFENGLLLKFLERRGYPDYAEKIAELSQKYPDSAEGNNLADLVRGLFSVFGMDLEDADEYIEIIRLRRERESTYKDYENRKEEDAIIIQRYFTAYHDVVQRLIEDKNNPGKIRALVRHLQEEYKSILLMDRRRLFYCLINEDALYPICQMLTYDFFRARWLESGKYKDSEEINKTLTDKFHEVIVKAKENSDDWPWLMKTNKVNQGEATWEDIELPTTKHGSRYMIISLPAHAQIRSYDDIHNARKPQEINGQFQVLDGIQYRHSSSSYYAFYVEV